ncbi:MAG: hypothetical protein HY520_02440 [Candidatus Aenigmarchaeota archaeon]|nr:hypothetical protein [Candidatus Aenigmarchaeota archaeon]
METAKMEIETVTELALNYIKKAGFLFARVISVKHEDGQWTVLINVGGYTSDIKTLKIADATGKITGYE